MEVSQQLPCPKLCKHAVILVIQRMQEYSIPTHCPVNNVKNAIPVLADGSKNAIQQARTLI